jgi:hypothetical protein
MQKVITHKGTLGERLAIFKNIKSMGFDKGRVTGPYTSDFNATDPERGVNIGSDLSLAIRWWFVNDSKIYSHIILHKGWFCDEHRGQVLKGVVLRLSRSKGF